MRRWMLLAGMFAFAFAVAHSLFGTDGVVIGAVLAPLTAIVVGEELVRRRRLASTTQSVLLLRSPSTAPVPPAFRGTREVRAPGSRAFLGRGEDRSRA